MFGALPTLKTPYSFSPDSSNGLEKDQASLQGPIRPSNEKMAVEVCNKPFGLIAVLLITSWILTSNATILINAYILHTLQFPYPTTLTTIHLLSFTLFTQLLARHPRTSFLFIQNSRREVHGQPKLPFQPSQAPTMTGRIYIRTIVPIGVLYAGSLVCSNSAYLTLGVGFIQMLKSLGPAAVLFSSVSLGLKTMTWPLALNVAVIVFGVAITAVGEMHFAWTGFLWQMGGLVFEAYRLGLIEKLLCAGKNERQDGLTSINPLLCLYHYAPVCAVMTGLLALVLESPYISVEDLQRVGPAVLFGSAIVAFALNVASVTVIGATSSLTLTICGVLKNALLMSGSVLIWHSVVTPLQLLGYTIATVGLLYYSLGRHIIHDFVRQRILEPLGGHTRRRSSSGASEMTGLLTVIARRKTLFVLVGAVVVLGVVTGFWSECRNLWLFDRYSGDMSLEQANLRAQKMQDALRRYWQSQVKLAKQS